MSAYYNEHDAYAAAWLRNLIAAGHIAPGDVDERDIRDVRPSDLRGYAQCHFFAGIGVWSHALRLAGWPDSRPVWTGSCPCQPFSAAGRRSGTADERHLWPHWHHLIRECRPATVLGEQVASKDGLGWLDLVCADMEGAGYAVGAADLCAAGVGAPHIRQRLWFVADANRDGFQGRQPAFPATGGRRFADAGGAGGAVGDASGLECERRSPARWQARHRSEQRGTTRGMADVLSARLEGRDARALGDERAASERGGASGLVGNAGKSGGGRNAGAVPGAQGEGAGERGGVGHQPHELVTPGATGFWADADWIPCRDGKARPVEPGTFPLAHGAPARVGRLRAYGNAIVAEAAATFIRAADAALADRRHLRLIADAGGIFA